MRSILLIFFLCFLASCAKSPEEEATEAIDLAQTYLSESKCDDALEVLLDIEAPEEDAIYIQVLASAYSCRAGHSEITFIGTDVANLVTSSANLLFKSLTTLTSSDETSTDSDAYEDMRSAITTILDSDGATAPSQLNREAVFGPRKAGDLGVQVLILSIVQLGKFLNHYGNTDADGDKGLGTTNSNTCFLDYTSVNTQTLVNNLPSANNCNSNSDGHPDLDLTTSAGKRRACEGLMLITNLLDVLDNIDLSEDDSLSSLEDLAAFVSTFRSTALTADPDLEVLFETTSQAACLELLDDATELNNMQLIFAYLFETGLQ
jgi:hypothetical protein